MFQITARSSNYRIYNIIQIFSNSYSFKISVRFTVWKDFTSVKKIFDLPSVNFVFYNILFSFKFEFKLINIYFTNDFKKSSIVSTVFTSDFTSNILKKSGL